MKRKITIVLTIFFAILAICNFSNATSEITEDRLIEALNEVSGYKKTATTDDGRERTISYEGLTCEIDNEKNIITLKMEDLDKTEVKYDLTNTKEPTFEYVLKYKKTMNYDEFGEEFARGELMQNALVTIASRTQGILIEDAGTYSIEKTFSESRINKLIEASMNFSNAINESKKIYV